MTRSAIVSAADPFRLSIDFGDARSITGRTQVDGALDPLERTKIILSMGQSLDADWGSDVYSPGSSRNHSFNIADGGMYLSQAPNLNVNGYGVAGAGLGCAWPVRLADLMIAAGNCDRVILVMVAIGGTTIGDWTQIYLDSLQGVRYDCKNRLTVACQRLLSRGLTPDYVTCGLGPSDAMLGTSAANFKTALQAMCAYVRSFFPDDPPPVVVAQSTHWTGTVVDGSTNALNIRAAQSQSVNHGLGIWAGPDTDALDDSYRADGVHWNGTGSAVVAGLWKTAINSVSV